MPECACLLPQRDVAPAAERYQILLLVVLRCMQPTAEISYSVVSGISIHAVGRFSVTPILIRSRHDAIPLTPQRQRHLTRTYPGRWAVVAWHTRVTCSKIISKFAQHLRNASTLSHAARSTAKPRKTNHSRPSTYLGSGWVVTWHVGWAVGGVRCVVCGMWRVSDVSTA